MSVFLKIINAFQPKKDRFGNKQHLYSAIQVKWMTMQFGVKKRIKLYTTLKMLLASDMSVTMALERMSHNFKRCGSNSLIKMHC